MICKYYGWIIKIKMYCKMGKFIVRLNIFEVMKMDWLFFL